MEQIEERDSQRHAEVLYATLAPWNPDLKVSDFLPRKQQDKPPEEEGMAQAREIAARIALNKGEIIDYFK